MFTTTTVIALAGFFVSATLESPTWHADYGSAQQVGREGHKPLAVFIASGKTGWNRVSQNKQLGKEVQQLLARNYVCIYVNTSGNGGKQLAAEFDIRQGLGLILSDSTGNLQAFRHEGDLPNEKLLHYLKRFADPERVVRTTESNPGEPAAYESSAIYPPAYYQPVSYPVYSRSSGSC
jgi:hypothetical protein